MRKLSQTKKTIDDSQKKLNERYDNLRTILATFERYGITDKDFEDFQGYNYLAGDDLASSLERASQKDIDEALDICDILNSLQQPKRWLFKRKLKDATVQALLEQLKSRYYAIAG